MGTASSPPLVGSSSSYVNPSDKLITNPNPNLSLPIPALDTSPALSTTPVAGIGNITILLDHQPFPISSMASGTTSESTTR